MRRLRLRALLRAAGLEPGEQLVELGAHGVEPVLSGAPGGCVAGDDHEVMLRRQPVRQRPERLPQDALHAVALDRAADAPTDRHAQPHVVPVCLRPLVGGRKRVQDEAAAGSGAPRR